MNYLTTLESCSKLAVYCKLYDIRTIITNTGYNTSMPEGEFLDDPIDPAQQVLDGDLLPRFSVAEIAQHTSALELAIIDENINPYIPPRSKEAEQILTPGTKPGTYMHYCFRRAYAKRGAGGRLLKSYVPVTSDKIRQHREEVMENTIARLGRKYNWADGQVQKLAEALGYDENEPDTDEIKARRADIFKTGVITGKGPIAEAWERLVVFDKSLPTRDYDSAVARHRWLQDSIQSNDVERLNRMAKITFSHEIKRALFYRTMHDNFARFRMQEHKKMYGDEMPFRTRDVTNDRFLETQPQPALSLTELIEKEAAEAEIINFPADLASDGTEYSDVLEHFWRRGLKRIRKLGKFVVAKLLHRNS